jgi:hypothetical protein
MDKSRSISRYKTKIESKYETDPGYYVRDYIFSINETTSTYPGIYNVYPIKLSGSIFEYHIQNENIFIENGLLKLKKSDSKECPNNLILSFNTETIDKRVNKSGGVTKIKHDHTITNSISINDDILTHKVKDTNINTDKSYKYDYDISYINNTSIALKYILKKLNDIIIVDDENDLSYFKENPIGDIYKFNDKDNTISLKDGVIINEADDHILIGYPDIKEMCNYDGYLFNNLLNEIFNRNQKSNSDDVLKFIKLLKPEQQEIFSIHSDDVEIFKLYNDHYHNDQFRNDFINTLKEYCINNNIYNYIQQNIKYIFLIYTKELKPIVNTIFDITQDHTKILENVKLFIPLWDMTNLFGKM